MKRNCEKKHIEKGLFSRSGISAVSGQASVEAAVLIPVVFLALLLLIQPGIILYDRIVMSSAAAQACRLLATKTDSFGSMQESCEAFVLHRLGSIPPVSCFHVHDSSCTWQIDFEGDESSSTVSVSIQTELRPLPLIDAAGTLLGLTNERGNLVVKVRCSSTVAPSWLKGASSDMSPSEWIGAWAA